MSFEKWWAVNTVCHPITGDCGLLPTFHLNLHFLKVLGQVLLYHATVNCMVLKGGGVSGHNGLMSPNGAIDHGWFLLERPRHICTCQRNQWQNGDCQKGLFKADRFSTTNYGKSVAFDKKLTEFRFIVLVGFMLNIIGSSYLPTSMVEVIYNSKL